MKIKQFKYSADNFAYLVYGARQALAIDAGAATDMAAFARQAGLTIAWVTNTHSHPDHTPGNAELVRRTDARLLNFNELMETGTIDVDGESVLIHHTPGHTSDSVTFQVHDMLITGDTLFNGTIGNCFSGDMKAFFDSIRFLSSLDPDSTIYAGHDYVKESMVYARIIDPENPDIDDYLARYDPGQVQSRLADEFLVNPYLRYDVDYLVEKMKQEGFKTRTAFDRFCAMYELC